MQLPGIYSEISSIIGPEAAERLADYFGGQYVYFPTKSTILRSDRDTEIRAAFNGRNTRELARKFALSEQRVRDILKRGSTA